MKSHGVPGLSGDDPGFRHFDLGLDILADDAEIHDLSDPVAHIEEGHHPSHPNRDPNAPHPHDESGMRGWASDLDLPGV
ncbi:MAG: hypothetical protein U0990_08025 [Candidatus Nanopelagicales bacterium]|nr:hypothetical protein [Candidatus Nanopelagicales bacterium]MDZ4250022.1 hypothetical protein [Candidatus Nanopelagicales bacterium]MDZ7578705.1 hypothetical protein [Candidatus Nanopelagicales bacterium]